MTEEMTTTPRGVDTARVTRPWTGYVYLDAVHDHPRGVLAFAHRGGAYHPEVEGLENTMLAFQHAVDLGYTYLETDVHAARDGGLFAFHDAALDRVTEHRGDVARLSSTEVAQALVSGREAIPTMVSLLEAFPDARFNVDLKSEAAVEPLAALVRATDCWDRVCVGSFAQARADRFRRLTGGRVAVAAGPREVALLRLAPTSATARVLLRRHAPVLQIPVRHRGIRILTPGLVARAHAVGMQVHVWTVDDPGQMRALLDQGVDGLMTDRTDLLREVLVDRGQWMGAQP